ncbi:hypothetical protein AK830_g3365 [Neonectria ditissima]|uniref:Uncharacterized protein n=1 Tax=Neonectria ditissima TaxID=78410 RepID=A0A0P7BI76_9HYPO|nr:hypothetical protein AK830_g3365 [Neonectria ditissima]
MSVDKYSTPTFGAQMNHLINTEAGNSLTDTATVVEQAWLRAHRHAWDTNSLPVRLDEATLSQACHSLKGQLYTSTGYMERAFVSSLLLRTSEQPLAYMQWLLGQG